MLMPLRFHTFLLSQVLILLLNDALWFGKRDLKVFSATQWNPNAQSNLQLIKHCLSSIPALVLLLSTLTALLHQLKSSHQLITVSNKIHLYLTGFPVASCLLVQVSLVQVACVAIVSTRVRHESWDESTSHPFWRSFAAWGSFAVLYSWLGQPGPPIRLQGYPARSTRLRGDNRRMGERCWRGQRGQLG